MYDTAKPRTLIIDHGGQVRNIAIFGSSGPNGIAIIILFLFLRRSCRPKGQDPGGLALYAGEGDYRVPAISDCRLILYKARPEICGRGSCICWKLCNFSSPRTRASRLLRYKSRTHVQTIKSGSGQIEQQLGRAQRS